jgi:hypothetical protein
LNKRNRRVTMATWEIEDAETIQFDEPISELDVGMVGGDLAVRAGEGPVTLEVRHVVGPPVEVELSGGLLRIRHQQPSHGLLPRLRNCSASVTLTVPASCRCRLKTVSAPVLVGALQSELEVESVSGDITVDGLAAPAAISTVSGSVAARGLSEEFRGNSVSGELTLEAFSGGSVRLMTVSGDVVADLQEAGPTSSADVHTTSGTVLLRLPANAAQTVHVNSVSGRLQSAFPGLHSDRSPGRRRLGGSLGDDGGGTVEAVTVSGAVSLLAGAAD